MAVLSNTGCNAPIEPPCDLSELCYYSNPEICFTVNHPACIETVNISSDWTKVITQIIGTQVCVEVLHPAQKTVALTVTPVGVCSGIGLPVQWTFVANGPACN